ncbi:hypothetical protein EON64_10500 [archaeon]|nr:MAG: hypothetical protein EON64_10500 [archaeon]
MYLGMSRDVHAEGNFQQALREAYRGYAVKQVGGGVRDMIQANPDVSVSTSRFSLLVEALKEYFHTTSGTPPLAGSLPDMISSTAHYLALQNLYRSRAQQEREEFARTLAGVLARHQLPPDFVSASEIENFCRRADRVGRVCTRSLGEEWREVRKGLGEMLSDEAFADPLQTPLVW